MHTQHKTDQIILYYCCNTYTLIFYVNKILILPILYTNNAYSNQSFIKTTYVTITTL